MRYKIATKVESVTYFKMFVFLEVFENKESYNPVLT